jgi:3-dehydroquinate synthase
MFAWYFLPNLLAMNQEQLLWGLPALSDFIIQQKWSQIITVIDKNVSLVHSERIQATGLMNGLVYYFEAYESTKTLTSCTAFWDFCHQHHVDRQTGVVIIGGGVTTDTFNYAASCWARGLKTVLVPTTLLAQVDAAIGGKTGINYHQAKNRVGAFYPATAVCLATEWLTTLPIRQLKAGLVEVLKHGLIADVDYFWSCVSIFQQPNSQETDWLSIIQRSIEIKSSIVAADPQEAGLRAILNYGHTIGHALESDSHEQGYALLHGEAVAIGMWIEALIARDMGLLTPASYTQLADTFRDMFKDYKMLIPLHRLNPEMMMSWIEHDKKRAHQAIYMSLLTGIGQASFGHMVEPTIISAALTAFLHDTQ